MKEWSKFWPQVNVDYIADVKEATDDVFDTADQLNHDQNCVPVTKNKITIMPTK